MRKVLLLGLGWLFLVLKYRSNKKASTIKDKEFAGSYSLAGQFILLRIFLILLSVTLLGLIGTAVYSAIVHGLT
ncbi:hypothetical protein RCC89_14395 [Cytophagaceae bacterium ABcell3]|nr:hypothetical protein RCC89_14395 [Cytophagaceae bacterium ABcell3]